MEACAWQGVGHGVGVSGHLLGGSDLRCWPVPDLGLWMPLGNNIIENTSTPWPNKFNDCKDMCGIIMLQLTMSRNVAATQTVTTFCP